MFDPQMYELSVPSVPVDHVVHVFNHWVRVIKDGRRGPKPVLTVKRRSLIQKAIDTYGVEMCLQAVDGCKRSPWHQGENPTGKRYDSIELILRDAEHIEMFCEWAADADRQDAWEDRTVEADW